MNEDEREPARLLRNVQGTSGVADGFSIECDISRGEPSDAILVLIISLDLRNGRLPIGSAA